MALEDVNECLLSSVLTDRIKEDDNTKQSMRNTSPISACILRATYHETSHILRASFKINDEDFHCTAAVCYSLRLFE